MNKVAFKSFGKINLFLELLGKREDGYWEIETIFQNISLFDRISFEVVQNDEISFHCNLKEIENEDNLIIKAANLLKVEGMVKKGVKIELHKNIPIGSGLGGGSSDAATTLKVLNKLWGINMDKNKISEIASSLGSDIPFFLQGGTCLGKGRGEIIKEISSLPRWKIFLIFFPFMVYSKDVYSFARLPKLSHTSSFMQSFIENKDKKKILSSLFNRLEGVVFQRYPEVKKCWQELNSIGFKTLVSGSGPTIFGFWENPHDLFKVKEWAKRKGLKSGFAHLSPVSYSS